MTSSLAATELNIGGRGAQAAPNRPWRDHYAPGALQRILMDADALVEKDGCAARACLRQALTLVSEQLEEAGDLVPSTRRELLAPWQIRKVVAHVDANLHETIRIADLAALARLTTGYFSKAFRESFDTSPHTYVMQRRMELAQRMLLDTDEALAQIALACGLCDQAHFSRVFRRAFGASPARWRRSRRGGSAPGVAAAA